MKLFILFTRQLLVPAFAVAVVVAGVILAVEVHSPTEIQISGDALAEARARHQRNAARAKPRPQIAARTSVVARPPVVARRSVPVRPEPEAVAADDPAPEPEPSVLTPKPDEEQGALLDEADAAEVRQLQRKMQKLYDDGEYESALREARNVLTLSPTNRDSLRLAAMSACAIGERDIAQSIYSQMFRDQDRRIVRTSCERHGIGF